MKTDVLIIRRRRGPGHRSRTSSRCSSPGVDVTVCRNGIRVTNSPRHRAHPAVVRRLFRPAGEHRALQLQHPVLRRVPHDDGPEWRAGRKSGSIRTATSSSCPPTGLGVLKRNFDRQQGLGCNVIWLEPDALHEKFPSMNVADLGAGVHSPDDGWLDPHSVLMGFRRKAAAMGTHFTTDEVTGLEWSGNVVLFRQTRFGRAGPSRALRQRRWRMGEKTSARWSTFDAPIEPLRRFEHYFESREPIEPLPYIKDPERLAFRAGGTRLLRRPTNALQSREGFNFRRRHALLRSGRLARAGAPVSPVRPDALPQHDRWSLRPKTTSTANVIIGPGRRRARQLPHAFRVLGTRPHARFRAAGRAMAELVLRGRYEAIDLSRFGWQRLIDGTPLREQGIV